MRPPSTSANPVLRRCLARAGWDLATVSRREALLWCPLMPPAVYNLVTHFVDRHVREGYGDCTAIVADGRRLTYGQVQQDVNRVGHGLRNLGVREEQRVMILLPDSVEFAAAYFG